MFIFTLMMTFSGSISTAKRTLLYFFRSYPVLKLKFSKWFLDREISHIFSATFFRSHGATWLRIHQSTVIKNIPDVCQVSCCNLRCRRGIENRHESETSPLPTRGPRSKPWSPTDRRPLSPKILTITLKSRFYYTKMNVFWWHIIKKQIKEVQAFL